MPDPAARGTISSLVLVTYRLELSMHKPIIVAVDPERDDDAPLAAAAALARITGSPLMVVGAYLHDPITNAVSAGTVDEDMRGNTLRALEARTAGTDADLYVKGGPSAARVLHDATVELDALMVIVGSTHRGPVLRVTPGTTAERLVHGAPCPVAVVPAGLPSDWTPTRVGAGFIDYEDGHSALRAAADLAQAAGGQLRAMTAVELRHTAAIAPYGAGGREQSRAVAQREIDAALAQLPAGARASGEVVVGMPAEALIALSEDVDLLVCGSRGYGPLHSVLAGSVTHAVLRQAHCPVVIVPRGVQNAFEDLARQREATAG
jgi:nucleotide-binding universal stress UspA family protein